MVPVERALVITVSATLPALVGAGALLLVPQQDDPLLLFLVHLSAVVGFGIALAVRLAPLARRPWFADRPWAPFAKTLAASSTLVALTTGSVALVTLASSAALRYQPSLQFLQMLSALDIAWAGAAIVIGSYLRWGRRAAWIGGIGLAVFCVFSIARYLEVVGFDDDNGWLVSGADLMEYVIPFDMAAALVAVVVLWLGVRHWAGRPMEQARPQS